MRLINVRKLVDNGDFGFENVGESPPAYAILSHTWEETGEVTYQDAHDPDRAAAMGGYDKIEQTCRLAIKHGLKWAWVDTCCIDKTSSAELTESINSMFRWYERAEVCFAFIKDLPRALDDDRAGYRDTTGVGDGRVVRPSFARLRECRWFKRGWTLQELIAPARVLFYDEDWLFRGDRTDLQTGLADITGVDASALRREARRPLKDFPLAHRMAWAAGRQTTRPEDLAYCLMGIFDVNMPLLYGEGPKAFRRLQEEIIRRSDDLTLFAWSPLADGRGPYSGVLAPSPAEFAVVGGAAVEPFEDKLGADGGFAIDNKGLRLSSALWTLRFEHGDGDDGGGWGGRAPPPRDDDLEGDLVTFLELGTCPARGHQSAGIFLRKVGPGVFFRDGRLPLRTFTAHPPGAVRVRTTDFYIAADIPPLLSPAAGALPDLPSLSRVNFAVPDWSCATVSAWMPEEPWDNAHQLFFVSQRNFIQALRVKVRLPPARGTGGGGPGSGERVNVVVISDVSASLWQPRFKVFHEPAHEALARYLFRPKSFRARTKMEDLKWKFAEVARLKDTFDVRGGAKAPGGVTLRATKKLAILPRVSASREIWCLDFVVENENPASAQETRPDKEPVRGLERRRKATEDSVAPSRRQSDLQHMAR